MLVKKNQLFELFEKEKYYSLVILVIILFDIIVRLLFCVVIYKINHDDDLR